MEHPTARRLRGARRRSVRYCQSGYTHSPATHLLSLAQSRPSLQGIEQRPFTHGLPSQLPRPTHSTQLPCEQKAKRGSAASQSPPFEQGMEAGLGEHEPTSTTNGRSLKMVILETFHVIVGGATISDWARRGSLIPEPSARCRPPGRMPGGDSLEQRARVYVDDRYVIGRAAGGEGTRAVRGQIDSPGASSRTVLRGGGREQPSCP